MSSFRILKAWGWKLFLSLPVLAWCIRYLLRPQQGDKAVIWVAEILNNTLILYMSFRQGRAPPAIRSSQRTTVCRSLRSCPVLFPYQAVLFPCRTLSLAQEQKFPGRLSEGNIWNFLKRLRWNSLAFQEYVLACDGNMSCHMLGHRPVPALLQVVWEDKRTMSDMLRAIKWTCFITWWPDLKNHPFN